MLHDGSLYCLYKNVNEVYTLWDQMSKPQLGGYQTVVQIKIQLGISPNKGKSKDKSLEIPMLESPPIYQYMPRCQELYTRPAHGLSTYYSEDTPSTLLYWTLALLKRMSPLLPSRGTTLGPEEWCMPNMVCHLQGSEVFACRSHLARLHRELWVIGRRGEIPKW